MAWKHTAKQYGPAYAWYACGIGASLAYIYPHTLGLEKYKEMITEKSEGKPVELDSEVEVLAQEIRDHFRWRHTFLHKGSDYEFVQTTQPLEFTSRGSSMTRWGAVIGVPILFTTSSLETAKKSHVTVLQNYNIHVTADEGKDILELFALSPAAKKFAVAREMYFASTIYILSTFVSINLASFGTYAVGKGLSNLLTLFIPLPGAVVISFFGVVPALVYGCIQFNDWYTRSLLAKSDKVAARLDEQAAAGGIEYYSKLIARKQALEQVKENVSHHDVTESIFDMKWRKRELSLEERKQRLEKALGQSTS